MPPEFGHSRVLSVLRPILNLPGSDVADELRQGDRVAGPGDALDGHTPDCATVARPVHEEATRTIFRLGQTDPLPEADEARLADAIDEVAPEADLVLVDTAGFGNRAALLAMAAADAVLVPCTPSRADVEQAAKTLQLLDGTARAARRAIPARVVPSRLKHATAVSRHVVAELDAATLPRTAAGIGDRVAFAEMTFSGRVPAGGDAGQEVAALVEELRGLGWIPAKRRTRPATIATR